MSNQKITSQKIVIEKNKGIAHALKKLVEKMPNSVISDGKITAKEWDATIDKLIEINTKRIKSGKAPIYEGGSDKSKSAYHTSFIVHTNQEIEFSAEEMKELFSAMGVEIKNNTSPKPENPQTHDNDSIPADTIPSDTTRVGNDSIPPIVQPTDTTRVGNDSIPPITHPADSVRQDSIQKNDSIPVIKADSLKLANDTIPSPIQPAETTEQESSGFWSKAIKGIGYTLLVAGALYMAKRVGKNILNSPKLGKQSSELKKVVEEAWQKPKNAENVENIHPAEPVQSVPVRNAENPINNSRIITDPNPLVIRKKAGAAAPSEPAKVNNAESVAKPEKPTETKKAQNTNKKPNIQYTKEINDKQINFAICSRGYRSSKLNSRYFDFNGNDWRHKLNGDKYGELKDYAMFYVPQQNQSVLVIGLNSKNGIKGIETLKEQRPADNITIFIDGNVSAKRMEAFRQAIKGKIGVDGYKQDLVLDKQELVKIFNELKAD